MRKQVKAIIGCTLSFHLQALKRAKQNYWIKLKENSCIEGDLGGRGGRGKDWKQRPDILRNLVAFQYL